MDAAGRAGGADPRARAGAKDGLLRPTLIAFGIFAVVFAANLSLFSAGRWLPAAPPILLLMWFVATGPFLGGMVAGASAGPRAVTGTAVAFALWSAAFVWFDAVASTDEGEWIGAGLALLFCALPLACLGALAGLRARRVRPIERSGPAPG